MLKKILNYLIINFVPYIVYIILRLIYLSCKKEFNLASKNYKKPLIIAMWHGELLMLPFLYNKMKRDSNSVSIIISQHRDGELIARLCNFFKFNTIRGSSSKNGIRVLIKAIKKLKENDDIAITPDGPRGPRHSVANGIISMAKKSKTDIITFNCQMSNYWQLNSWDKFAIPKPFSTIKYFISEPFSISDELDIEKANIYIKKRLLKNAIK